MKKKVTYTQEEVLQSSLEYFNGDGLAADVWMKKYCLKDMDGNYYEKNPNDMHRRLAEEFARIETKYPNPLTEQEIFDLIKDFKHIVPGGSPMAGIGNDMQVVSLSNCFVIGNKTEADSYGGIMRLDEHVVQLQKRRGGVGIDMSFIRPNESKVNNSALTSTGVVPFMERYSNSTREVAQGGRRGALMESISIKHPDSELFIDAKVEDGKVTGANVSVKITDEFMQAVIDSKPFVQQYPIDSKEPRFKQETDANRLWKKIVHNAWKSAEPGILFWDTIVRESLPDCYVEEGFKTVSTNPCVTLDSWVMTVNGPFQVRDLIGKQFEVYVDGKLYKSTESGFFKTGENKEVFQIETNRGLKAKTTDNHQFKKVDREERGKKQFSWVELKNLNEKDVLNIGCHRGIKWGGNGSFETGWLLGNLLGDGTFENNTAILRYWGNTRKQMKEYAVSLLRDNLRCRVDMGSGDSEKEIISIKSVSLGDEAELFGINKNKTIVNSKLESSSSDFYRGFLSGWFDADGTVSDNAEKGIGVRLSSSVLENLEIAQRMLLRLGIFSTIYKNRRTEQYKEMPDGKGGMKKYKILAQHELVITKNNLLEFNERIGFVDKEKKEKLNSSLSKIKRNLYQEKFMDKIKSITFLGLEDVYDCQIPGINEFDINGISVHNCGEIPLCPYDSCRLLCLNLYSYVENPYTKKAKFNFDLFKDHAKKAQRLMDDLVDLELEKVEAIIKKIKSDPEPEEIKNVEMVLWELIKEKAIQGRRTGLGITSEGDMLAALNLIYGTDEANEFAENLHRTLKLESYRSSVQMAKERGAFKIWDPEKEKKNPFLLRIKEEDKDLYSEIMKYGRRNIALLTIAPTGSVSVMTQTTSGIEPAFMVKYMRRRKINPQEKDAKVDFVDKQGDSWQEYPVFHNKFETYLTVNGYNVEEVKKMTSEEIDEIIKNSPYNRATSRDVDWVKKVEMQGRVQKHIDHSISVTVNLPEEITEEMVSKVYETAWKCGCKGVTVYREGSRSGVLVSQKTQNQVATDSHAIKRPKSVEADVMFFQNNKEKWISVVGKIEIDNEVRPYELFTGAHEAFFIPLYVKKGKIVKRKIEDGTSVYDFVYIDKDGEIVTMPKLSRSFNQEYWNYAKLISGLLRHRMPMEHLVSLIDSLNLRDDSLNTWKGGVVRILKKYIKDGTLMKDKCPNCGAQLMVIEGCEKCQACGTFSKCG